MIRKQMKTAPARTVLCALVCAAAVGMLAARAEAQVAKGLVDPNVAIEQELAALPYMMPATVKTLMAQRPFAGAVGVVSGFSRTVV